MQTPKAHSHDQSALWVFRHGPRSSPRNCLVYDALMSARWLPSRVNALKLLTALSARQSPTGQIPDHPRESTFNHVEATGAFLALAADVILKDPATLLTPVTPTSRLVDHVASAAGFLYASVSAHPNRILPTPVGSLPTAEHTRLATLVEVSLAPPLQEAFSPVVQAALYQGLRAASAIGDVVFKGPGWNSPRPEEFKALASELASSCAEVFVAGEVAGLAFATSTGIDKIPVTTAGLAYLLDAGAFDADVHTVHRSFLTTWVAALETPFGLRSIVASFKSHGDEPRRSYPVDTWVYARAMAQRREMRIYEKVSKSLLNMSDTLGMHPYALDVDEALALPPYRDLLSAAALIELKTHNPVLPRSRRR